MDDSLEGDTHSLVRLKSMISRKATLGRFASVLPVVMAAVVLLAAGGGLALATSGGGGAGGSGNAAISQYEPKSAVPVGRSGGDGDLGVKGVSGAGGGETGTEGVRGAGGGETGVRGVSGAGSGDATSSPEFISGDFDSDGLPFTGLDALVVLGVGLALLLLGTAQRRLSA